MKDAVLAAVTLLKADAAVAALLTDRVFGQELPGDQAAGMPRVCVVVRRISGIGGMGGFLELERGFLEVIHYGETPLEAETLREATRDALKQARRQVVGTTLVHGFDVAGSPHGGRDQDTKWPFVVEPWEFMISEVATS